MKKSSSSQKSPVKKPKLTISQSMAVKYRPNTIEDLVGQSAIVTKFIGMQKSKIFPSCFLLYGPSGTGKTTIGRLINRYVNCQTLSACGECDSCKHLETHPDLVEMNMANTRGIDDARALIEAAKRMPRYNKRVFLLDEVHQLTLQASNTVLKTLEEPPENTIWVLATTNPEKLLATIKGRCHPLEVKHISETAIVKRLAYIGRMEGQNFKQIEGGYEALKLIAELCNGQMRDSIQLLESVIFALRSGEEIRPKDILDKYVSSMESDVDKLSAWILIYLLTDDMESTISATIDNGNSRALLIKIRWLIHSIIQDYCGKSKFLSYSYRYFQVKAGAKKLQIKKQHIPILLKIQRELINAEQQMNQGVSEDVALLSALGQFL